MRNILLSAVALTALTGVALAADLPSTKEAPAYIPPPPVFTWTGFYIGADIGGGFSSTNLHSNWTGWNSHSLDTSGFMGGGYVGYNYQMTPNFVIGVEGDFQGLTGSSNWGWTTNRTAFTFKTQQDWLAAINGRLGYAMDRFLIYAIGGAAWGQGSANLCGGVVGGPVTCVGSKNADLFGFDIGGGVEYAFTPNWLARVEYRYYGFDNYNMTAWGNYTPVRVQSDVSTIRVGLAYKFGVPEPAVPVAAKY